MTDWFARPVLHVTDVEVSLGFYIDQLGFTSPWRYEECGRVRVAQVDRQGCALILSDQWQEKIGKGLVFISLNVEPGTPQAANAAVDALREPPNLYLLCDDLRRIARFCGRATGRLGRADRPSRNESKERLHNRFEDYLDWPRYCRAVIVFR